MASSSTTLSGSRGCAFLVEETAGGDIFTPEDLTGEHRAIARTTDEFWANEVEPNLEAIRDQEPGVARSVLCKSAELGLTAIQLPERFGGMELDLASVLIVAEHLAKDASYAGWHSAHTGIGTLPLLYFGSESQKQRYLPRLARVELLAAYALTEPQAGSDALAARTRADLDSSGTHYLLNGQKMWISNGGAADLFTVFAKVGGEKFTAFLVERAFPGVTSGAEEQKMGIKGTSTTAVYFDNVSVPVENVLGEIGRGHVIAFNILNAGRLKLGASATGAGKNVLSICLRYAKQRRAFGSAIAEFGAIQHKLAEMAIRLYAAESALWRVAGLIQAWSKELVAAAPDALQAELAAIEEYAAECSMIKVYASEVLDYVADEGVQIHGGYGFHQHYAVERFYRDSRINRLFEGTNEINRLVIAGMPLKRGARRQNRLLEAAESTLRQIRAGGFLPESASDPEFEIVRRAKRIFLFMTGMAHQKYGPSLEKQQEICMGLADIMMDVFAMEAGLLRARKLASSGRGANAAHMTAVLLRDGLGRIEDSACRVFGMCSETAMRDADFRALRWLTQVEPPDGIGLRRQIAGRLLNSEAYVV